MCPFVLLYADILWSLINIIKVISDNRCVAHVHAHTYYILQQCYANHTLTPPSMCILCLRI